MKHRSKLSGGKIAILTVVGLFFAWEFLHLPEVIEAVLTFSLAGVVPGTNIVLSPDTVIHIAGVTIGLIILLIALRPIIRAVRGKDQLTEDAHAQPQGMQDAPIPNSTQPHNAMQPHEVPQADQLAITPAQAFREQTFVTQPAEVIVAEVPERTPGMLQRISGALAGILERVMPKLFTLFVKTGVAVQPKLLAARVEAYRLYVVAKHYAVASYIWIKTHAVTFWRWLIPQLWKFDTWLESKVQLVQDRVTHKVENHHTASTVADLGRHAKKAVRELELPQKAKKATAKAKPYVAKAATKTKPYAKKAHATAKKAARKVRTPKPPTQQK